MMLIIEVLYLITVGLMALYGFNSLFYTWFYRRTRGSASAQKMQTPTGALGDDLPFITVQLPIYNERYVAARLINAVAALDWPNDRLQIQVLDDSSDDTGLIVASTLANLREGGMRIEHLRRPERSGYKAGALEFGLESAQGEFVAIFDADFMPQADFLHQTIPSFADPTVGCVQTRWGHVNRDYSRLTQAQALGIDGHFLIEQNVRNRIGAFLNFNGTAGVWRRASMDDAGGWQGDTLTEDLDLSYRAQLRSWRIAYLPDVVVAAELPVEVDALKRQQFRWAKGSLQTARKLLGSVWRAPEPLWRKVLATLHLTNYAVHPLMVLNLLFLLPITSSHSPLLYITPFLTLAAIGPPAMYWTAMQTRGQSIGTRIGRLLILMTIGVGLSLNNSKAALEAFTGVESEFKRTPKFAVGSEQSAWQGSSYALPRDPTVWGELLLAIYAALLLAYCMFAGIWWVYLWVGLYLVGYSYLSYSAFHQAWQKRSTRSRGVGVPSES